MIRFWRTPGVTTKDHKETQIRLRPRKAARTGSGSATATPATFNSSDGKAFTGVSPT